MFSLYFGKWNFLALRLEKILIFQEGTFRSQKKKTKKNHSEKMSDILGNGIFWPQA